MDNTEESPVVLSICPGLRGLERGLERAIGPVSVAAYVEIEAFICANLVCAMEAGILATALVWTDVKTFDVRPLRDRIDWLLAGYPCQPFSNAGKQLGELDPRHLFPHLLRIIEAGRPVCCLFENVEGHLGLGYDEVYRSLRDLGYRVESGLYSAAEAGAPHQRNRLFILAIREDADEATIRRVCGGFDWNEWTGGMEHSENIGHDPREECDNNTYSGHQNHMDQLANQVVVVEINGLHAPVSSNTGGKNPGQLLPNKPLHCSVATAKSILRAFKRGSLSRLPVMVLPAQLNPGWVAQLMGTTLEKTFFVPMATV